MTVTVAVDAGIPIPSIKRNSRYPWRTMEIGESFLIHRSKSPATQVSRANSAYGRKFTLRREGDNCRVWRVE